jgi:hypothetical protein
MRNVPFAVVYRGYDPLWAAMLADALRAEGINCHHVGTQDPALADIGSFACEQRLEVPCDEVDRAMPLIEGSMNAAPVTDSDDTAQSG